MNSNEQFIDEIGALVVKHAPQYDIRCPSAVIAQAINESGWGKSALSSTYHNYFGMKCGTKWTGPSVNMQTKEEYEPGTLTTISDNFRVYGSMDEGVRGYFEFIQLPRYQNLRGITDPKRYLQTIKDDGYATSSRYVDDCMALVDEHNLKRFDTSESENNMAVYLAQASCDEHGKYVGGQAGNQSGTELNVRRYYSSANNPWKCYRAKDATVAKQIAENASGAVSNMNIGYDQGQRNSIRKPAQEAGLKLAAISTPCECDCSSLQGMCAICAGMPDGVLYRGNNLPWTGDAGEKLLATGLVTYVGSGLPESQLVVGDMLVRDGHAVIVVSGQAATGTALTQTIVGGSIDELARAVIAGRYGTGDARKAALGEMYPQVQARVNEMLSGTANTPGTSTGTPRLVEGTYKVIATSLNVRDRPSMSGNVVASYGRGDTINSIAADTTDADGYVWAHYTAYSGATRYVALGTSDGSDKYLAKI